MSSVQKGLPVFFGLGSNLGNKQHNIETAYRKIEERVGKIVSRSAFYFSSPMGFESENSFVNSVCKVHSLLDIYTIFEHTRSIEKEIGRTEKSGVHGYSDRIIDIDLLLVEDLVLKTPSLVIPHPRMHLRQFVIDPLYEIAPDVVHPVMRKSIRQLKQELDASE